MATILLADDDAAVRDLVRRALSSDGHNVHVTQDGVEALESLGTNGGSYDILITDVDMPQLDGISLAEKALVLKPGLAVILMSGFSDQLERAARLQSASPVVDLETVHARPDQASREKPALLRR